jgi:long-chain acyl-CoA synthetase
MDAVGNWAERQGLGYAGYVDLAGKTETYSLLKECIEQVNRDLAEEDSLSGSQIKRFLILHKELDADDDELTRTKKVRRSFVAEKYQVLIKALYDGSKECFIETQVKFEDGRSGAISADLSISDAKTFQSSVDLAA